MFRLTRLSALLMVGILACATLAGVAGWMFLHRPNPSTRGDQLAAAGDYNAARVEYRNAVLAEPRNAALHLKIADLQMKLADPASAERELRSAAALGADRWAVIPPLGEALIAQGNFADTLTQIPQDGPTQAVTARLLLLRSIAQLAQNDLRAADATLARARRTIPNQSEVSLIDARIAAARNDTVRTEKMVDAVLAADPDQLDALIMKEQLQAGRNERAAALVTATQAVKVAPWSAMARIELAKGLIYANRDAEAQTNVDAVLRFQPRFIDALYLRAILMARAGRYAQAADALTSLESAAPHLPQVLYYQAMVAARLGQSETAIAMALRYSRIVPNDPDGIRLLAEIALTLNRPAQAIEVLERAIASGQEEPATISLLGRAYAAAGNTAQAYGTLDRAARLAPENPEVLANLGLFQLRIGDPATAIDTLQRSIMMAPDLQTASEALVAALIGTGETDRAETALAKLKSERGDNETVGILTGMLRARRNDLPGAQTAFEDTLRAFPKSTSALVDLVKTQVLNGQSAIALATIRSSLAKSPANLTLLNAFLPILAERAPGTAVLDALNAAHAAAPRDATISVMLANTLTQAGNAPMAVTMLQATAADADMPNPVRLALARAQVAAGAVQAAKTTYRKALEAEPADLRIRGALVDLLLSERDFDGAGQLLRSGLVATPGNMRIMTPWLAIVQGTQGLDPALRLAAELRATPANMPNAAALKGDVLIRAKRPAEAADAYRQEYRAAPSAALVQRLAAALTAAGRDDEAATALRSWLDANPKSPAAAQALAQLDIKANRFADAKAHLGTVLELLPNDPLALNNLAWTYRATNDPRARETAQRAYLAEPNPTTGDTLAWIMVQEGATKTALPLLQLAHTQRPADPGITYHLAVALRDDGQAAEALKLLQPLVAANLPFDEQDQARKLMTDLAH